MFWWLFLNFFFLLPVNARFVTLHFPLLNLSLSAPNFSSHVVRLSFYAFFNTPLIEDIFSLLTFADFFCFLYLFLFFVLVLGQVAYHTVKTKQNKKQKPKNLSSKLDIVVPESI